VQTSGVTGLVASFTGHSYNAFCRDISSLISPQAAITITGTITIITTITIMATITIMTTAQYASNLH